MSGEPSPIFIGGSPRSGTTLLRVMLDSHPAIACGPELRVIPALAKLYRDSVAASGDLLAQQYELSRAALAHGFAEAILALLTPTWHASGKALIAEKTPANGLYFAELGELFPHSKFVHVLRDGRDVVSSLLDMNWTDERTGKPMSITRDAGEAATAWVTSVETARSAGRSLGDRYTEIRYEAMIATPREALAALLRFLGVAWSDDVLAFSLNPSIRAGSNESSADQVSQPLHAKSVGRWRQSLSAEQLAQVMKIAGATLAGTGYAGEAP